MFASPIDTVFIPRKESIVSTSDVDGVNTALGYWGSLSYPMRRRLGMVVDAMVQKQGYGRILDAGYGCGIFLADLYRRLDPKNGCLYGVDIHDKYQEVHSSLTTKEQMDPKRLVLSQNSLSELPFEDNSFDLVVSVSVLEHIEPGQLPACLKEIRRVAKPGAEIILGFPTDCIFIRLLAFLQKQDLKVNHPSTHEAIFAAIQESGMQIELKAGFPKFFGPLVLHYNVKVS